MVVVEANGNGSYTAQQCERDARTSKAQAGRGQRAACFPYAAAPTIAPLTTPLRINPGERPSALRAPTASASETDSHALSLSTRSSPSCRREVPI